MTWTINGVDPRTAYGLVVAEVQGWADAVVEKYASVAVPGVPGLVRTALAPEVQPRKLVAAGTIVGTGATSALRIADARTKLDSLRAALALPALTLVLADLPTRQLTAVCEGIVVPPGVASMVADRLAVTISLVCLDPYYVDIAVTTVTPPVIGTITATPMGTAPVRPRITATFSGSIGGYTINAYTASGTAIVGIGLTGAFIAGDVLVIDCAACTITLNGVARMDLLSAGEFFALDVTTLGDYATSAWPGLAIAGTSFVTTAVTYRKAWR